MDPEEEDQQQTAAQQQQAAAAQVEPQFTPDIQTAGQDWRDTATPYDRDLREHIEGLGEIQSNQQLNDWNAVHDPSAFPRDDWATNRSGPVDPLTHGDHYASQIGNTPARDDWRTEWNPTYQGPQWDALNAALEHANAVYGRGEVPYGGLGTYRASVSGGLPNMDVSGYYQAPPAGYGYLHGAVIAPAVSIRNSFAPGSTGLTDASLRWAARDLNRTSAHEATHGLGFDHGPAQDNAIQNNLELYGSRFEPDIYSALAQMRERGYLDRVRGY